MSLTEALFIVAAILVVVDFFFLTDVPTHIAYVIIVVNIIRQPDIHFLYRVLFGLLLWFALVTFHYIVWRKIVLRFVNKFIAPDRHIDGARGRIGMKGKIIIKDDKILASIQDDLWSVTIEGNSDLDDGDAVEVVGESDGTLVVRSI